MRAAATLPESARLVGINTSWMIALGWGMASAIGAIAGMMIAPVVFLEPNMMLGVLIYGFAAAVLGGPDLVRFYLSDNYQLIRDLLALAM